MLADVQVLVVIGSPDLESVFSHALSIHEKTLNGSTIRFMIHVDLETVGIISLGIR